MCAYFGYHLGLDQILVLGIISTLCCSGGAFHEHYFNGLQEIENVQIEHKLLHRSRRHVSSGGSSTPEIISTEINGDSHSFILNLRRNRDKALSPVFTLDTDLKRLVKEETAGHCVHVYEDVSSSAHAVVDQCDVNGDVRMVAEVILDNEMHVILPKGSEDPDSSQHHGLYKTNNTINFTNDYISLDTPLRKDRFPNFNHRLRRQTERNIVELMFIVDFSLYQFWYQLTSGTVVDREAATLDLIRRMYTFTGNGVRMRYESLQSMYGVQIDIELTSIYVLTTVEESAFTEFGNVNFVSSSRGVVDALTLLTNFEIWINQQKVQKPAIFANNDHYTLLTGREIELSGNAAAAGYAYYSEICTSKSVSIAEDKFNFIATVTATHELGHSLGAVHDGAAGVATCSDSDGYILSLINGIYIDSRATHPWKFSHCSADSFATTLWELQGSSNNCLRRNDSATILLPTGRPPGQVFKPDQQCKQMVDSDSVFWRQRHVDELDQMCTAMACTTQGLSVLTFVIPGDGTSCGDKKWCWNGQCVFSKEAPSGDETCFFGDQPGGVIGGKTCDATLSGINIWKCYQINIRETCCASCGVNITGIGGCEYGDANDCSVISAAQCYNSVTEKSACCETCFNFAKVYETLPPDCRYGDRKTGCVRSELVCQQFLTDCCATCAGFRTSSTSSSSSPTTPVSVKSSIKTSPSDTPRTTDQPVTDPTETKKDALPSWVIPVAAGVGGVIGLSVLISVCYRCFRKNPSEKYKDTERSDDYNNRSGGSRRPSNASRRHSGDSRRGSEDNRGRSDNRNRERSHGNFLHPEDDRRNMRRASDDIRRSPRHEHRRGSEGTPRTAYQPSPGRNRY